MDEKTLLAPDERTAIPGLSRREFMGYCSKLAALMALSESAVPKIANAVTQAAQRPPVIWSDFQMCTGCTVSLVQNAAPGTANLIFKVISLNYQETVMAPAGAAAEKSFSDTVAAGGYLYVVEGAIPTKITTAMCVGGKTAADICKEAAAKAKAIVAIGNCATYGGIQAAKPNPTGSMGVSEFLKKEGIATPVINIPTCPGNADMMIATIVYFLALGKVPDLDAVGRPLFLYGETIHDNCERRGHFEKGEFVENFADGNEDKNFCLYKVGCKGPDTYAPCSKLRWNNHMNWCVGVAPCIGCAEPQFWDKFAGFYTRQSDVTPGLLGIQANTVGYVIGGATVVGLGAHFIGQVATGRLGKGGPAEDEGEVK